MLNNRGQSLVLFVMVLPILLLIVVLVIDVGRAFTVKQDLDNINNIVLDYGLDNLNKEDLMNNLEQLVKLNNDEVNEVSVRIEDNKIYLESSQKVEGIFSKFVDISIFDIKSSYVGYIADGNKKIEEISG